MTTLPEEAVTSADIIRVITDLRLAILQDDDEGLAEHAEPMVKAKELIAKLSASPFLSVQGAVKKLEWELVSGDHYAEGAGTHYNIYETKPGLWNSVTVKPGNVRLATNVGLEAAKAAAQADFEARILSALEPSAARELALEEGYRQGVEAAAQKAAEMLVFADTTSTADREIPAAIRALSSPDHADAGKVEGDGWKPIESAPKDGIVLAWCEDAPPQSFKVQAARVRNGKFLTSWNPTHWRPLPSAPSQEVAGS